jgi:transposase-like protein
MVRPGRDRLSGVVEVDETFVGGEKAGKRGRGAEGKALVVIAVEDKGKGRPLGRIRLQRVADASGNSLLDFVTKNIEPGSTVRTDGWKGYNGVKSAHYNHVQAKDEAIVAQDDKDMLPLAHRVASLLKRWLLGTYQGAVKHSHIDYYLDEYVFRFNRRTSRSRGKLFYRLLQQAVQVDPVCGKQIRGGAQSSEAPNHKL